MVEPDFLLCDVCRERLPRDKRLHFVIGRYTDQAGSMSDEVEHVDLCHECLKSVLRHLIDETRTDPQWVFNWIRGKNE